jgi:hypothetical protein
MLYTSWLMRCSRAIAAAIIFCLVLPNLHAAQKLYNRGKLIEVEKKSRERVLYYLVNTPVTQDDPYYEIAVRVGDATYLGEYTPRHAAETLPDEWIPGTPVEVRMEKHYFFLKRAGGDEMQVLLLKRTVTPATGEVPDAKSRGHN